MRYKPFTGLLPVLPQYGTAQYSPLGQPDYLRQLQTESNWVRHLQTASRPLYRPFPALYRLFPPVLLSVQYFSLFPVCTSVSTVLPGPLPGTRYLQDPVPGVRAFVLLTVQYYRHFSCIRVVQDPPLIWPSSRSWSPFIKTHEDCPLI